jgi:hypothetical protein
LLKHEEKKKQMIEKAKAEREEAEKKEALEILKKKR